MGEELLLENQQVRALVPLLQEVPQLDVADEVELPVGVLPLAHGPGLGGGDPPVWVGVQVEALLVERALPAALVEVAARFLTETEHKEKKKNI